MDETGIDNLITAENVVNIAIIVGLISAVGIATCIEGKLVGLNKKDAFLVGSIPALFIGTTLNIFAMSD